MKPYDYNTYFILALPEVALEAILAHCVGDLATTRYNNDKSKALVKLPIGYDAEGNMIKTPIPPILITKTPYTHTEILVELAKPEWNPEI